MTFVVENTVGDTVFASGLLDGANEVRGIDLEFEPHHNLITDEGQVQIYEMVPGDTDDNVAFAIDRMYRPLKDNRLVPVGFQKSHYSYDSTEIVGLALEDEDFNLTEGVEGSGGDIVWYRFPIPSLSDTLKATATLRYQSVPPRWVAEMFESETPEINAFKRMYQEADGKPEQVASATISTLSSIQERREGVELSEVSTSVASGWAGLDLQVDSPTQVSVELWSSSGKLVEVPIQFRDVGVGEERLSWIVSHLSGGIYFARVTVGEQVFLRQFLVYR